jgi:1-acyl-sn-glycerol-3-phosphate acyltransferase
VRDLLLELHRVGGNVASWLFFVFLTLLWGALVVPPTLLLRSFRPGVEERFSALTAAGLRLFVRTLPFARIRLEGAEKRLEGPRILVVNHASRLDSPVLLAFEPRLAGPVRGYMLRVPVLGTIIRLLGFFDVDAGGAATISAMYRAAGHARKRDGGLLFYPEGTRSKTGEIGSFRRGAFQLAVDEGLPIQPVVLEGFDVIFPPGSVISPLRGRHLARIRYLEPVRPPYGSGPRREVARGLAERVRETLVEELARLRAERASSQAPTSA